MSSAAPRRRLRVAAVAILACALAALGSLGTPGAAFGRTRVDPLAVSVVATQPGTARRLSAQAGAELTTAAPPARTPVIDVDTTRHYQTITGFGAAMTDSSAQLIEDDLSPTTRNALMAALFGPGGLDLSSLRIPIGASDFTANGVPYSYDDGAPDPGLSRFSIAHDQTAILPALLAAQSVHPGIGFLATPWSLPAWMKANDSLTNSGDRGTLLAGDYASAAAYIVRFLQAYAGAGIHISAITPANEPTNPTAYPGMNLSANSEAQFIQKDLAPALRQAGLAVQIFGSDLGWQSQAYASAVAESQAIPSLAGIAWHCYYGDPTVMSLVHALDPRLAAMVSECSPGISTVPISEVIIGSLRNWAGSVDLWNLALNPQGGPVEAPNRGCGGCYGLVTIDPTAHTATPTLAYDELGQASEYIEPGAVRVASNSFVTYHYTRPGVNYVSSGVDDVAVVNPDGSVAVMVDNDSTTRRTVAVHWHHYYFSATLAPQETVSYRWR